MQNNKLALKRVAAVNDISCFGKCSLTVALPLLSRFGLEAVPLPTAILSTHTGGFTGPSCLDMTEEMQKIISHWERIDLRFDCVHTGYLLGKRQIDIVYDFTKKHAERGSMVLVDPVMADNGKLYSGFQPDYPAHMRELCALADVITPNITEAALLADMPYTEFQTPEYLRECAQKLCALGAKACAITGARPNENEICDVIYSPSKQLWHEEIRPFVRVNMHGCGDVYASVLCARLLKGADLAEAARCAAEYTDKCMRETMPDVKEHWYGLKFEALMSDADTGLNDVTDKAV